MPDGSKEIKKLDVPEFKSDLPVYLLKECSDKEIYIMEQLSIQRQQNNWLVETLTDVHYNQQITNGRVNKHDVQLEELEGTKKMFKSKPVLYAFLILGFIVLFGIYPYLLTLEFKELIPLIKDFFL